MAVVFGWFAVGRAIYNRRGYRVTHPFWRRDLDIPRSRISGVAVETSGWDADHSGYQFLPVLRVWNIWRGANVSIGLYKYATTHRCPKQTPYPADSEHLAAASANARGIAETLGVIFYPEVIRLPT